MAVLRATATAPLCKLCQCGRVDEANGWAGRRGELDENGRKLTLEVLSKEVFPVLLGGPISTAAIKRHIKLHTEVVLPEEFEQEEVAKAALAADLLVMRAELDKLIEEGLASGAPGHHLRVIQVKAHLYELKQLLAEGKALPKMTPDSAGRAADSLNASKEADSRLALTGMIGTAIGMAFGGKTFEPVKEAAGIAAGDVIDGDAVEVVEDAVVVP